MKNNETPNFCSGCGMCCKHYAGWYSPEQVFDVLEGMSKGEDVGLGTKYQIDAYDGSPSIRVLRPAHTNTIGEIIDRSWGGRCVNLTDDGCYLSFDDRPLQCQSLVATAPKTCEQKMKKEDIRDMWKNFQEYFKNY